MKSRELVVGEYRRVKTYEQLLATDKARSIIRDIEINDHFFCNSMKKFCGEVLRVFEKLPRHNNRFLTSADDSYYFVADFFTNDYFDHEGNEIKVGDEFFKTISNSLFVITEIDNFLTHPIKIRLVSGLQSLNTLISFNVFNDGLKSGQIKRIPSNSGTDYVCADNINTLDKLENEANQTLTKIKKLREIEAKQGEIDLLIEEQDKRIEEYEKGGEL